MVYVPFWPLAGFKFLLGLYAVLERFSNDCRKSNTKAIGQFLILTVGLDLA